jgi:hypothetical protein
MRTACRATARATRQPRHQEIQDKGTPVFVHVNEVAERLPEGTIVADAVESFTTEVDGRFDPATGNYSSVVVPESFVNCRTVHWRAPAEATACRRGAFLESGAITVAGIDGLYIRLYPHGKGRAAAGFASVYVGSAGTTTDIALRISMNGMSRVLVQRLNKGFVDGFVNFCDLRGVDMSELVVSVEVLRAPVDKAPSMSLSAAPLWATWTVPAAALNCAVATGDRITSDVFSVDGLGEDASFVVFPQGDTVDELSKVSNYVNVGLFGSAGKDVTFRMTAGRVSKVLTACSDRYRSRVLMSNAVQVTSSGEFFDPCFAPLKDMVESDGSVKFHLQVLDTQARQTLHSSQEGLMTWRLENISHLRSQLHEGEALTSRYLRLPGVTDGFVALSVAFKYKALEFGLTKVSLGAQENDDFHIELDIDGKPFAADSLDCCWNGQKDTKTIRFNLPGARLPDDISFIVGRYGSLFEAAMK